MPEPTQPHPATGEHFEELARQEFDTSTRRPAVWAECFQTSQGDETAARDLYIKLRARQMEQQSDSRGGGAPAWYEMAEVLEMGGFLRGASLFVDVGSSTGPYVAEATRCMRDGRIIAIEANPETFEVLRSRTEELGRVFAAHNNRLEAVHAAVSDACGSVDFYMTPANALASGMTPAEEARGGGMKKVSVPSITLDSLLGGSIPDFVKVDVEGAEWCVLAGAGALHRAGRTTFLVEVHPWGDSSRGKRPSDVLGIMSGFGYGVRRLHRHWLFEPKRATPGNRILSRIYGFILNHVALRRLARRIVEWRAH